VNIGPNDPSLQSVGVARPLSPTPAVAPTSKAEGAAPVAAPKGFLREVSDDVESIRESEYRAQAGEVGQEIDGVGRDRRFADLCQSLGIDPHGNIASNLKKLVHTLGAEGNVFGDLQAVGGRIGAERLNEVSLKCLKHMNAGFLEGEESKELRQGNVRALLEELASAEDEPGLSGRVDLHLAAPGERSQGH